MSSEAFRRSERMTRFLRHVVENSLREDVGQLKESAIGHAVFDRPVDYDTKQDPVVRNEARRLRTKLEQYYASEGAEDPWSIEIPRGGYSPVFTRRKLEAQEAEAATAKAAPRFSRPLVIGIALALLSLGVAWWVLQPPQVPVFGKIRPVSSAAENELHATYDRQSKQLAYSSNAQGNYDIYLREPSGRVTRLTHHPADELHPSFSPDGKELLFARASQAGFDIVRLNLSSEQERVVARSEGLMFGGPVADPTEMFGSPGPVWSPLGDVFAFTTATAKSKSKRAIHLFHWKTGRLQQLTYPSGQQHDLDPSFSPDGRQLAFGRWLTNSTSELHVVEVASGKIRKITAEQADYRGSSWLPDGRSLIVSSNRSGLFGLWFLSLADGKLRPMTLSASHARDPVLSPDGKQLVFSEYRQQSEVWRSSTIFHHQGPGIHEQVLRSTRQNHSAQYSPDGASIAYVSDRSGSWEIWVEDLASHRARQITKFEGPMLGSIQWSPQGSQLAFDARPAGNSAIFLADLGAGNLVRKWSEGAFEEKMPSWAHDGRWLVFNSNRKEGQQLWKAPLQDPSQATFVAREFAADSRLSADGNSIYFESENGQLRRVPIAGGATQPVDLSGISAASRVWTVNEKGIWLVDTKPNPPQVRLLDPTTGQYRLAAELPGKIVQNTPSLSVSPDRQWVLYSLRKESKSQLLVLEANGYQR